jgi:predicted O-linked N-acetylglucosamine transferase (SPINDLY family)
VNAGDCSKPTRATGPAPSTGWLDRGIALLRERRFAEAAEPLRQAVAAEPGDPAAWCALGDALQGANALDDACTAYRESTTRDAERFAAWWGLGCALGRMREPAQAAEAMERALALRPQHAAAWHNLGKARYELGCIEAGIDAMRRAAELDPRSPLPLHAIAMAIPGDPRADAATITAARRASAARALGDVVPLPSPPEASPSRKLRIGYLSANFKDRHWMKPVWTVVNRHDRDRFEVVLLSDNPRESIEHGYVSRPEDGFVALTGLDNAAATARIAALDLDLLVDLNGWNAANRLGVVKARPARRVIAWFNSFATSGLDAYDAVIADEVVAPSDGPPEFEEPIVRVPFCHLTFEVTHAVPDVAPPPVLENGHLTFGCLAPVYKLVPDVVRTLARILAACPGSRLLVRSLALHSVATRAHLEARFAEHGVASDTLILEGPIEHFRFLETYARVDVALDTFPYSGATTAADALWQGVPMLTVAGDRWAGRLAASLLHHAGLDEFVVADREAYIEKAVALYHDPATPQRLASLRRSMREHLRASSLCDGEGFARAMERAYFEVMQAPRRGDRQTL